ncbi:MAG TPA: hypothetical protein VGP43_09850 [Chitinophagaceae bacterium]|nr:hypothetical protein [Chitinophagaceae bacterium]
MLLLVSEMAFTYCKPEEQGGKDTPLPMLIKNDSAEHVHEYTVIVSAKNWRRVNCSERFVDIPIEEITGSVLDEGLVMIYLTEGDKYLALPFNYYQVRRILSFQPSFEPGHAYISIYGNFITNVSARYEFKLLIVSKEILKNERNRNWNDFNALKKK